MAIIVKGSEFVPAPDGIHNAVCVDVADLGMVTGQFGTQHKIKVVWEIEAAMPDGRRFTVQKRYTASLNEKSNLFKDLKSWRGKPFTAEELKEFDVEKVVGVPCQLVIVHEERDGQVYANVQTVIKAAGTKLAPSGAYTRVKDRPQDNRPTGGRFAANGSQSHQEATAAEEIPF